MEKDIDKIHDDRSGSSFDEGDTLLNERPAFARSRSERQSFYHILMLYIINGALLIAVVFLGQKAAGFKCTNPQLGLYSPMNDILEYKTVTFDPFFLGHESPWTRGPKEVKDKLWDETYQFGISGISEEEAKKLHNDTLEAPHMPGTWMIQLEVFHNLHCLNMIRKTMYPEQYPEMWEYYDNGTVNHGTLMSLHLDHCIDALRQSTMCEADITPVTFVHNFFGRGVYPNLVATHTCRDFDKIVEWAKEHEVTDYEAM